MDTFLEGLQNIVNSINKIKYNTSHIGFNSTQDRTNIAGNVNIGGHMINDYALKSEVPDIENLSVMIENL
jgi:hypothetical protein